MDERSPGAFLLLGVVLLAGGCSQRSAPVENTSVVVAEPEAPSSAAAAPVPVSPEPASAPPQAKGDRHRHARPPGEGDAGAAAAPAPAPAPSPAPEPAPARYPHVEAIFYAESPERLGEVAKACLEVLPPGVSASAVDPAAYQCRPEAAGGAMGAAAPVVREDGATGVDSAEYMKAALDFDSEDFEVPTRELLLHFTSPGQHKSFEFRVIPRRIGQRRLTVQLFTTDKDGVVIDDIFDGSSTVQVRVGSDAVTNLGWVFEHWEGLTSVSAALVTLWALLTRRPRAWLRSRLGLARTASREDVREPGAGES